jgi:hypothetical protein
MNQVNWEIIRLGDVTEKKLLMQLNNISLD